MKSLFGKCDNVRLLKIFAVKFKVHSGAKKSFLLHIFHDHAVGHTKVSALFSLLRVLSCLFSDQGGIFSLGNQESFYKDSQLRESRATQPTEQTVISVECLYVFTL